MAFVKYEREKKKINSLRITKANLIVHIESWNTTELQNSKFINLYYDIDSSRIGLGITDINDNNKFVIKYKTDYVSIYAKSFFEEYGIRNPLIISCLEKAEGNIWAFKIKITGINRNHISDGSVKRRGRPPKNSSA